MVYVVIVVGVVVEVIGRILVVVVNVVSAVLEEDDGLVEVSEEVLVGVVSVVSVVLEVDDVRVVGDADKEAVVGVEVVMIVPEVDNIRVAVLVDVGEKVVLGVVIVVRMVLKVGGVRIVILVEVGEEIVVGVVIVVRVVLKVGVVIVVVIVSEEVVGVVITVEVGEVAVVGVVVVVRVAVGVGAVIAVGALVGIVVVATVAAVGVLVGLGVLVVVGMAAVGLKALPCVVLIVVLEAVLAEDVMIVTVALVGMSIVVAKDGMLDAAVFAVVPAVGELVVGIATVLISELTAAEAVVLDGSETAVVTAAVEEDAAVVRKYKRLFTDHLDGLYPNVPYSLNKRKRWMTTSPASLLANQTSSLELCVVNKKATNWHTTIYDHSANIVTHFHVLDDDVITTFSATRGRQSLQFYTNLLGEERGLDKDEAEPARMHYNVVSHQPVKGFDFKQNRKFGRTGEEDSKATRRRLKRTSKKLCIDEAFPSERIEIDEEKEMSNCCEAEVSRQLSLEDFMRIEQPSTSPNPKNIPSSNGMVTLKPSKMIDISTATNAPGVFENNNLKLSKLDTFDLKEEIPLLAPGYCAVHWFGPERVSVASKLSSNPSPVFVLFFELSRKTDILRPPPESFLRFTDCKGNFMAGVNSAMLAIEADRADTFAQLELLRSYYQKMDSD
ncbi:unnamed protein product [Cylicocyclus nassatus]|uniref:Uncharacterized protein n=1 Tax=Cylicocyclus nassatus TaxID=53992 RepID=A0AA36MCF6_CYLNA|nr:unnamed protein product [Cylicocyclus nassatus]